MRTRINDGKGRLKQYQPTDIAVVSSHPWAPALLKSSTRPSRQKYSQRVKLAPARALGMASCDAKPPAPQPRMNATRTIPVLVRFMRRSYPRTDGGNTPGRNA
jgi:hypothetical protein